MQAHRLAFNHTTGDISLLFLSSSLPSLLCPYDTTIFSRTTTSLFSSYLCGATGNYDITGLLDPLRVLRGFPYTLPLSYSLVSRLRDIRWTTTLPQAMRCSVIATAPTEQCEIAFEILLFICAEELTPPPPRQRLTTSCTS